MPYKVGDRVTRFIEFGEPRRKGVITSVYRGKSTVYDNAPYFYEVKWDDSETPLRDYLEVGLERE